MNPSVFDILRHGAVEGVVKLRGHQDDPLSEEGWSQMRAIVDVHNPPWQIVVTSPLQRCLAFAEEISRQYNVPLEKEERFKEISFGEWEGRPVSGLSRCEGERLADFWCNIQAELAPGGESYDSFEARVILAWDILLSSCQGKHGLLVTHAGVVRVILRHTLGFPVKNIFQIEVPHACLTRVQIDPGTRPRILFHAGKL